jgi:CRISPR system Cascade subunit CasE
MSLFASILRLDRAAHRRLNITDPYSLHRVVYSLFEDVRSDSEKNKHISSGILYADRGGDWRGRQVLLLSDREPRQPSGEERLAVETQPIPPAFLEHEAYRFKVIMNPTRQIGGKRIPVKGREAIAEWFCQRAPENWGFEAARNSVAITRIEVLQFKKHETDAPVTLAQAHIEGRLQVKDRVLFQTAFQRGIGRGHAFGCGLLQIEPLRFSLLG